MNKELFSMLTNEQQDEVRKALLAKMLQSIKATEIKPIDINAVFHHEVIDWIERDGLPDEIYELLVKHLVKLVKNNLKSAA